MNIFKAASLSPKKIIIPAVIFYIIVFSFLSIWKLNNFFYNSMDLAIINQVFYNSAQGNFFSSSIHPPSYLGDHVTPILFLLLPFYFFYQSPVTILILQTIILALSAWPIYLIGKKIISKNWGIILSLIWLANPFVQNINLFEFHFLPFAVFFTLFAFYFFEKKNFWAFLLFSFLALLTREDVALIIFMFGVISLVQKRSLKWVLTPLLGASAYFITALKIAGILSPGESYKFLVYYSYLGSSPYEAFLTIVSKPWLVLIKIFSLNNIIFTLGLFLPVVFVPLVSPLYLLLGLGIFLQLILTESGGSTVVLLTHYTALLLPALFIALTYSLKKVAQSSFPEKYPGLFNLVFFAGVLYSFIALGPLPATMSELKNNPDKEIYDQIVKSIPEKSSVASSYSALANLSSREEIYSFNYAFLGKKQFLVNDYALPQETEHLLIDFKDFLSYNLQYQAGSYESHYSNRLRQWPEALNSYGLVKIDQSVALFKKNQPSLFELVKEAEKNAPEVLHELTIDENLKFLGYNKTSESLELFWQTKKLEKNYFLKINNSYLPLGYGLLLQDKWSDKIVKTVYYFRDVSEVKVVEVISGGLELDGKRSSVEIIDELKILEEISIN